MPKKPKSKATCALWYESSVTFAMQVGLFESEEDAADFAVGIQHDGSGEPIGIELATGEISEIENWPEYAEAIERFDQAEAEKEHPPPPTRTVLDPFTNQPVVVTRHTPDWVGLPAGS